MVNMRPPEAGLEIPSSPGQSPVFDDVVKSPDEIRRPLSVPADISCRASSIAFQEHDACEKNRKTDKRTGYVLEAMPAPD